MHSIHDELAQLTRKFVRTTIAPHIAEDEEKEKFRKNWISELGKLGLTGIPIPEELGGVGLGYSEYITVIEEIAKVSASYAISVAVTGLGQVILSDLGSAEQKRDWLPKMVQGQWVGAFSLSEAGSGSDAASLKTRAVKSGDSYVLNGNKLWCTQADSADLLFVMARTNDSGAKGISCFGIPAGTPGLLMGKREKKMGLHCSHTMELILENCKIPAKNLIGKEGDGFGIAMRALDSGRITIAATALGLAEEAMLIAAAHANVRNQFGKVILDFQGISFQLADMLTEISAARLLVKNAAKKKDQGLPFTIDAAMAKLFATDTAMKVTTNAVQILGGSGYTKDFPVERLMREAKVLQIVEGTNQIQRLLIGRSFKGTKA